MYSIFDSCFYTIKDDEWLSNQRTAGKILRLALDDSKKLIVPGTTTKQIDSIIESSIRDLGGIPTFKGYMDFPAAACISVNKQLVHGVPSDYIIQEGDIVKIDSGVTVKGAIADSAFTYIVGNTNIKMKMLVEACEKALYRAIASIRVNARMGDIGNAVAKMASSIGAKPITSLTGHGLDYKLLHAPPVVPNIGNQGKGIRFHPRTTLAIEPMLVYGSDSVVVGEDGFAYMTDSIGAHFEHTVFIHEDKVEIITLPES